MFSLDKEEGEKKINERITTTTTTGNIDLSKSTETCIYQVFLLPGEEK
jgi:hypothetical protein